MVIDEREKIYNLVMNYGYINDHPSENFRLTDDFLCEKKLNKYLLNFYQVITANFPPEYLSNLFRNINELNITYSYFLKEVLFKHCHLSGTYTPSTNTIKINKRHLKDTIYHELLHMSSSCYTSDGVIRSGFSIQTPSIYGLSIGDGLTEGYTDVLNKRFFKDQYSWSYYKMEYDISLLLEKIVGRDKMGKMYFQADLKGLIDELSNYSSPEEAIEFIKSVDNIRKKQDFRDRYATFQDIFEYLIKIYIVKNNEKRNFRSELKKFIDNIPQNFVYHERYYNYDFSSFANELLKRSYLKKVG